MIKLNRFCFSLALSILLPVLVLCGEEYTRGAADETGTPSGVSDSSMPSVTGGAAPGNASTVSQGNDANTSSVNKKKNRFYNPIRKNQEPTGIVTPEKASASLRYRRERDSSLLKAKDLYAVGKLNEAEAAVNYTLRSDPGNGEAAELRQKIAKSKERVNYAKQNMANEYIDSAGYLYRTGNVLDALLDIKRALTLDPGSQEGKSLYLNIYQMNQDMINQVPYADREAVRSGVKSFLKGDYAAASNKFRKLEGKVEIVEHYLPIAESHIFDSENKVRSDEYFVDAIDEMRRERYQTAQNDLEMALQMDPNNFRARLMIEQVDIELTN